MDIERVEDARSILLVVVALIGDQQTGRLLLLRVTQGAECAIQRRNVVGGHEQVRVHASAKLGCWIVQMSERSTLERQRSNRRRRECIEHLLELRLPEPVDD